MFLALWKGDMNPHFWNYTDTNAFRIVKVRNSQGTAMVQAAINLLCPNGFSGYQAGDGLGYCGQSELDEANSALNACYQLINEGSSDIAACAAAVERLEAAVKALDASVKKLEPGFYYMVNLGRQSDGGYASPYDDRNNDTPLWNYGSNRLTPCSNG